MDFTCRVCKEIKPLSECAIRKNKPNNWCKECKRAYDRNYTKVRSKESKVRKQTKAKIWRLKSRQFVYDYLKSHPCIDCGESDPIVLEFDHLFDKEFHVGEKAWDFSIDKLSTEIEKCEVRCSNCHKRKTAEDFGWYTGLRR